MDLDHIFLEKYYLEALNYKSNKNYISTIEKYKQIIQTNPINIYKYYIELADIYIYEEVQMYNEAIECYMEVLKIVNINKLILIQIGHCYRKLKKYDLSLDYVKKAYDLGENNIEIYNNLVLLYYTLKDYDTAIDYGFKCIDKFPDMIETSKNDIYFNLSLCFLSKKMFKDGFDLYDYRLVNNVVSNDHTKMSIIPLIKFWDGQTNCNNLLVIYEQGLGDNIQFYRFIIELSKLYPNIKITFAVNKSLTHTLKKYTNINVTNIITEDEIKTCKYDYKTYICSLPNLIHIKDNIIDIRPNEENYIHINNEKLVYWKNILNTNQKRKIGFTYKGTLISPVEKNIPLEEFKILLDLNIELICLHKKDDIQKDIDNITFKDKIQFLDIDKDLAFEDTICILKNIDLLITVDTSIVHLAGVLNVKTWLLLGKVSDWRWGGDDEHTTYWYNSVELIRMKENKELKDILKTVKEKLLQHENKE